METKIKILKPKKNLEKKDEQEIKMAQMFIPSKRWKRGSYSS